MITVEEIFDAFEKNEKTAASQLDLFLKNLTNNSSTSQEKSKELEHLFTYSRSNGGPRIFDLSLRNKNFDSCLNLITHGFITAQDQELKKILDSELIDAADCMILLDYEQQLFLIEQTTSETRKNIEETLEEVQKRILLCAFENKDADTCNTLFANGVRLDDDRLNAKISELIAPTTELENGTPKERRTFSRPNDKSSWQTASTHDGGSGGATNQTPGTSPKIVQIEGRNTNQNSGCCTLL